MKPIKSHFISPRRLNTTFSHLTTSVPISFYLYTHHQQHPIPNPNPRPESKNYLLVKSKGRAGKLYNKKSTRPHRPFAVAEREPPPPPVSKALFQRDAMQLMPVFYTHTIRHKITLIIIIIMK
jgi:hypothetical protein